MDYDDGVSPQHLTFQTTSPRLPRNEEEFGGIGVDRAAEAGLGGDLDRIGVGGGVKPVVVGLEGGVDIGVLSRVFKGLRERRYGGRGVEEIAEGSLQGGSELGFSALFVVHVDRREELKGVGEGGNLPSRAPVKVVKNNSEVAKCIAYLPLFDGKRGWKEPGAVFVLPGGGSDEGGEMDRRLVKSLMVASSSRDKVCVLVEGVGRGKVGRGWEEGWEVWKG
ncbi:hypothetical protein TrCOL_g6164 [Triparma columacea]|uniref:Uncharacterized protein n=1 Tax=Triparma columacea TaxID=722753 RepID=A0A9W7G480_9STRA|nr:hypothetical protein TrCOL_g6164 [Triparma columacea]